MSVNEKTIQPQEFYSFEIEFHCKTPGVYEGAVELETNLNPFERTEVKLKCESYFEKVCFEGIQNDVLKFEDILMKPEDQKLGKMYFEMKNYSHQVIRYDWQELND